MKGELSCQYTKYDTGDGTDLYHKETLYPP